MEVLGIPSNEVNIEVLIDRLAPEEKETMAKKEAVVIDFFLQLSSTEEYIHLYR